MRHAILVTGATGFLGTAIIQELVSTTDATVYALVRETRKRTTTQRLEALWYENPTLCDALPDRVIPVAGNIEQAQLGMETTSYEELARTIDVVIHTAAEVGVNQTAERFWNVNVRGTQTVLDFARHAHVSRYVHISTAYVAGSAQGHIPERLFGDAQYNSLYEQSKHEGELLVSTYEDVPSVIVRPSQIVGDSRTGFIASFNTVYYPLKRYLLGKLRVIPVPPDLRLNLVPVDYVARLTCRVALAENLPPCYVVHAVGRRNELPTVAEIVDAARTWAKENLDIDLPKPVYVPIAGFEMLGRMRNLRRDARPKRRSALRNMLALAPYFFENRTYDVDHARTLLPEAFPDWHEYVPSLLAYATRRGFLNYTDRTVSQQILMRLRPGASTHVTYYDVDREGVHKRDGKEVRKDILQIADALLAYGVKSGSRVATIGINEVRYFSLDAALGLVGAINVPIYYTSAERDVYALVKASGAKVLFAGTDRMLDGLDLERLGADLISMSSRDDLREGIRSWESFLALAHENDAESTLARGDLPYVSPNQTATIRYTSGTTGTPKGVVFTQQQIRWMGEVMPAILDWKTRTAPKLRYLSFLPMSHVVEGILVAYAPYYILTNMEMYYLNDFPSLADALPKVRPSIFFSVPRFYEKVWNQFSSTGAGRFWIGLPDGAFKRLLAPPLRHAMLRRAGLDRCRQLIVGSAPIGMDLLESFRSLGIEIHNAFGVTEAPLITLSPLGKNELGSVGQLLPSTEVRLDEKGLVYVRGPQVTRCYDGISEPAVDKDGWFCTGDLGTWSPSHSLELNGRQKEILVTSYGKNIAPQKIEVLLKGIQGVSEAMVVADGRPFTTALLWLEDELAEAATQSEAAFDFQALDAAVRDVNDALSHPEQVKRWIVCATPLSVSSGELTPNLKVRRNEVTKKRADLVRGLYEGWDEVCDGDTKGVLHGGAA